VRRECEGRRARAARCGLLVVALTVSVTAAVGAVAAPSASAHHTGPCETYTVAVDLGRVHRAVESRAVENNTSSTIPVTFTSSVAQTVSTTFSASASISTGINVSIINASVSATLGVSTTNSLTTTIGVNVGPVQLPPNMTLFGDWGVFGQLTEGTYWKMKACSLAGHTRRPYEAYGTAFSPVAQGWKVWQQ
jgi:hypothetical protein